MSRLREVRSFQRTLEAEGVLVLRLVVIVSIVLSLIDGLFGTYHRESGTGLLSGIFSLAILIPSIAVSFRRLTTSTVPAGGS